MKGGSRAGSEWGVGGGGGEHSIGVVRGLVVIYDTWLIPDHKSTSLPLPCSQCLLHHRPQLSVSSLTTLINKYHLPPPPPF